MNFKKYNDSMVGEKAAWDQAIQECVDTILKMLQEEVDDSAFNALEEASERLNEKK